MLTKSQLIDIAISDLEKFWADKPKPERKLISKSDEYYMNQLEEIELKEFCELNNLN